MDNHLSICPASLFSLHTQDGLIVENAPKFGSYCKMQQTQSDVPQTVLKNSKFDPQFLKTRKNLALITAVLSPHLSFPKSSFGLPLLTGGRTSVASWSASLSCCQRSNTPQHPVRSSLT